MNDDISFLEQDAVTVAQQLIGWSFLAKEQSGAYTGGTIIETEAYSQDDAASHSHRGKTKRNEVMFGPAGILYVYFTYGMHWCVNIVTGPTDHGEAVLIRALQPLHNLELIRERRHNRPEGELTNGPAKICQALDITGNENGTKLNQDKIHIQPPKKPRAFDIKATERIGITHDTGRLWRFVGTPK